MLTPVQFRQGEDASIEHNLLDKNGAPVDLSAAALSRIDLTLEVEGVEVLRFSTDSGAATGTTVQALTQPTEPANQLAFLLKAADTARFGRGQLKGWLRTVTTGGAVALTELYLGRVIAGRIDVKN